MLHRFIQTPLTRQSSGKMPAVIRRNWRRATMLLILIVVTPAYADEGIELRNEGIKTPVIVMNAEEGSFDEITKAYSSMGLSQAKFNLTATYANLLGNMKNTEKVKRGVDEIVKFREAIPEQYGLGPVFENFLKTIIGKKETLKKAGEEVNALQEQIDYIKSKMKG